MCEFRPTEAVLVCHACMASAAGIPVLDDGHIAEDVARTWGRMHRLPCAHVLIGVIVHGDGCARGLTDAEAYRLVAKN